MISPREIVGMTAEVYGVSADDIMGRGRKRRVAEARQMAIYLTSTYTQLDYNEISAYFGRYRSTLTYTLEKIAGWVESDERTRRNYALITEKIQDFYRIEATAISSLDERATEFAEKAVEGSDPDDLLPISALKGVIAGAYKQGYSDRDPECFDSYAMPLIKRYIKEKIMLQFIQTHAEPIKLISE